MKKSLLVLILSVSGFAGAQTINFADANLKAKLLETGNWLAVARDQNDNVINLDANGNGEIEVGEASAAYFLNISGANISNLSGLEYFVNLKTLQCSNNPLNTFDAALVPNLKTLMTWQNNLATLDVSSLTALEHLSTESNPLTSLNVAGLSNLKELWITGSSLSSLDLSGLTTLREFVSTGAPLATADLTNLIAAEYVSIEGSQLTSIDLSSSPLVQQIAIQGNSLLESINLKNGVVMQPVADSGINNNPNLQTICVDEGEEAVLSSLNSDTNASVTTVCMLSTDAVALQSQISVYPNPTTGIITISVIEQPDSANLYDLQGRLLQKFAVTAAEVRADLSARAAGVYILAVTSAEGTSVLKIVKE